MAEGHWDLNDELDTAFLVFMHQAPEIDTILEIVRAIPEEELQRHTAALLYGLTSTQMSETQKQRMEREFEMESILEKWMDEAAEKRYEEGKQEGKLEGKLEEKRATAKMMLLRGIPLEEIADLTDLSLKEIQQIKRQLSSR